MGYGEHRPAKYVAATDTAGSTDNSTNLGTCHETTMHVGLLTAKNNPMKVSIIYFPKRLPLSPRGLLARRRPPSLCREFGAFGSEEYRWSQVTHSILLIYEKGPNLSGYFQVFY